MLKLKPNATFHWPVKVQVPQDGRHVENVFKATFKQVDRDRFIDVQNGDPTAEQTLLDDVLVGWDGVGDEDGNPLDFTPENRRALLQVPYVRTAVIEAFFEGIGGRKRKN